MSIFGLRLSPILAALASAAGAMLLLGCSPAVPDTVRIGVGVTMSGPGALRGQDLANGAQLAVDHINNTGLRIGGKPVKLELVAKDDKGTPDGAKQVAQELVDAGVHGVIGHVNTSETQAAIPIYAAKGLPHLFTSTNPKLTSMGSGNNFRLVANDAVQARALASFAWGTLQAKRLVALVELGNYGKDLYDGMVAAAPAGQQVVEKVEIDVKAPVNEEMSARIRNAKPDVVVVIGRELQALSLMEKLAAAKYTDVAILGVNPVRTTRVAQDNTPMRAVYTTSTTIDVREASYSKDFTDEFRAKFKSEPVWGAHYAYDAVLAITDAMKRAGSVEAAEVVAVLKRPNHEPMTRMVAMMRFTPEGEQKYPSIGVYQRQEGRWEPNMRSAAW